MALTEETWGQPAYYPYDVMVHLVSQVKLKKVSSDVMKAMLEVISLFPIGSHVALSDGTEAKVIRRGHGSYTEPIVERLLGKQALRIDLGHEALVDLSQTNIKVSAPLPHPTRREQRLDEAALQKLPSF